MATAQPITLTFLGAAGTVTGSKYLLTIGERKVLVDSGMFQGEKEWREKNWEPFPVPPSSLDAILLTHAHMDHVGYLPALVKNGFEGPIYASEGTVRLAEIVLRDAGHLQEKDAEHAQDKGYSKHNPPLPLYTVADVEQTLPLFKSLEFDQRIDLGEGLEIQLTRTAHILASASINVWVDGVEVLFSGDLGRHDHPVLRPRGTPQGAPYVLIESTYGNREHPEPEGLPHEAFADIIRRTIGRGGSVLVPAFAVDRTEVILKTLTEMRHDGRIPEVPIFVNSPMALAALAVYRSEDMRDELRPDLEAHEFVDLPNLREVHSTEDSIKLNNPRVPCIIIASSGMATGGRVLHHLEHMLPDHKHSVVLTGYQAVGTRGRLLMEGVKQLKMHGRYVPVRAEIMQDNEFSVHGDCSDLLDWLRDLQPKPDTVYCVHGDPEVAPGFAERIEAEFGINAVVPSYGEVVRLQRAEDIPAGAGPAVTRPVQPAPQNPPAQGPGGGGSGARTVQKFAQAVGAQAWDAVGALLAPAFSARLSDGRTLGRDEFISMGRDNPEGWAFRLEDVVDAGDRVATRGSITRGDETLSVADFFTLRDGLIVALDEIATGSRGGAAPEAREARRVHPDDEALPPLEQAPAANRPGDANQPEGDATQG